MADIAGTYTMGTNPAIHHTISYETYRSGQNVYYRFRISIAPVTGASYFGYNLLCSINLNGSEVVSGYQLKATSPSRWSNAIVCYFPSSSGWYTVNNVGDVGTLSVSAYFWSGQTSGTAYTDIKTVRVVSPAPLTPPTLTLSAPTVHPKGIMAVGASGGSWGDGGPGTYTYECRVNYGEWQTLYTGPSRNVSFALEDVGATYGSYVEVWARLTNSLGQQSDYSRIVGFYCLAKPDTPENFLSDPTGAMHRTQILRLRWDSCYPNSGTLAGYEIQVRYNGGDGWTDWHDLGMVSESTSFETRPDEYSFFNISVRGQLEYSVRAQNSYGVYSDYAYLTVSIKGGLAALKIGGAWKEGQVFLKINGAWKEADAVYVKNGSAWSEQS